MYLFAYLFCMQVCIHRERLSVFAKKCRQGVVPERVHLHALVVKCRNNFKILNNTLLKYLN